MAETRKNFDENGMRIRRERRSTSGIDADEIVRRVLDFVKQDDIDRRVEVELRAQRYAKFRMWTSGESDWPWEGSSDIALPDLMTDVLALEDTLHNAVMSNRPITNARALQSHNTDKQDLVDDLLDTQLFVEQKGEKAVEEAASCFVMDGSFTAFVPWVKEDRKVAIFRTFPGFDEGEVPRQKFEQIVQQEFPKHRQLPLDEQGWDWEITEPQEGASIPQTFRIKFYTADDGAIEMVGRKSVTVYDGPRVLIKDYEDVLTPARTANLQPPGPSNPGGATHVILIDHPPVDEIQRLVDSGFYDLVSKEDLERITGASDTRDEETEKEQKDVIQGVSKHQDSDDDSHNTLTRYLCFDLYDIDGSGVNMDMMWWVLKEPALLLKAKPMTEMYPADPPRRPLAEASLIPIKGRRGGIGLLEMMESLHDFKKQMFDQMIDAGTIGNMPIWFYRATSNIKPEVLRMWPGDGMPLADPKNDIYFPNIGAGNAASFGINVLSLADQMQEKLTVRGDLQLGRVPIGRSSALRTSQNLQSLMQAGEARPERVLRRFFMGWIEVMAQMHELNRHFLPEKKKFRIIGIRDPHMDPYREVDVLNDLKGRFQFDFSVNVLNASKIAQQDSLQTLLGVYMSEIALQLGIVTPDGIYRMLRDFGKAHGQKPENYLTQPSPEAYLPPILAVEAITQIIDGEMPKGRPMEGAQQHMDRLQEFLNSDQFGYIDSPGKLSLFRTYLRSVSERIKAEQMAKAAGSLGGMMGGSASAPGGPPPDLSNPPVNENEMLDETLPTAGGGGNGAIQGALQ